MKTKWSKRKIEALRGSIKKWGKIYDGTGADEGDENCPLCKIYSCDSCPIGEAIGTEGCFGTPYET